MTVENLKKEIESIRNFLGDAPVVNLHEKRKITVDRIEVFFNMCDELNSDVDSTHTMLDDLLIKLDTEGVTK